MSKSKRNFKHLLKDLKKSEKSTGPKINPGQKLILCMIVKNEEELLPGALESALGVVDEMIIVDTGSTDKTVEIARSYGAKVFHKAWEDSFAIARNESLKHASNDWILIMDADERIPKEVQPFLRSLLIPSELPLVYNIFIKSFLKDFHFGHYTSRLFKKVDETCFFGAVHEQLYPRVGAVTIPEETFYLEHYGYEDQLKVNRKMTNRNIPLLKSELERLDKTNALYSLYSYYMGSAENTEKDEAIQWLNTSIDTSIDPDASYLQVVYSHLITLYLDTNQIEEALAVGERALEQFQELNEYPTFLSSYGHAFFRKGDVDKGIKYTLKAIEVSDSDAQQDQFHPIRFKSSSWGLYVNLGIMYQYKEDKPSAEKAYQSAFDKCPQNHIGYLVKYLDDLKGSGRDSVVDFLKNRIELSEKNPESNIDLNSTQSLSNIYLKQEKPYEAIMLQSSENGKEMAIQSALGLAQIYQKNNRNELAKQAYKALIELDPENFKGNLGLATLQWVENGVEELALDDFNNLKNKVNTFDDACFFAEFLMQVGALDKAEELINTALTYEDASHHPALKIRAVLFQLNNQFEESENELKALIEAQPEDKDCQVQLGNLYLSQQKYDEAKAVFSLLIDLDNWYIFYALSVCYFGENNLALTEKYLNQSIALDGSQQAPLELKVLLEQSNN